MKLKIIFVLFITFCCFNIAVLSAPHYMDTSYQLDALHDRNNEMNKLLDQNQPGGFSRLSGAVRKVSLSGWINADAYFTNQHLNYNPLLHNSSYVYDPLSLPINSSTDRVNDLLLNNVNLFFDSKVNSWVSTTVSLIYSSLTSMSRSDNYCNIPNSLFVHRPINKTFLDTTYATIANFQFSPLYIRIGKQYLPFGHYDPYAFVQSENPTALFSEINQPAIRLGFISLNGLNASAYLFTEDSKLANHHNYSLSTVQNGGVDLGWNWNTFNTSFNLSGGWITNVKNSNFLSSYYLNSLILNIKNTRLANCKVPAWNVNVDLLYGNFDMSAHWIVTTRNLVNPFETKMTFIPNIKPKLESKNESLVRLAISQKVQNQINKFLENPNILGLELGLTFPLAAHQSRIALGWQKTNYLNLFFPKNHMYVDFLINIAKWFDVGLAVIHDMGYNLEENISQYLNDNLAYSTLKDKKSTFCQLRASIKFA